MPYFNARVEYEPSTGLMANGVPISVGGGPIGTFASTSALQAANPAASNVGKTALVGVAAPYDTYSSDGNAWNQVPTANTSFAATVVNQTGTLAALLALAGTQGQIGVPTDFPGVVRFTGVAGAAQHLAPYTTVKTIDASTITTVNTAFAVDGMSRFVRIARATTSTATITLNLANGVQAGQTVTFTSDRLTSSGTFVVAGTVADTISGKSTFAYTFTWLNPNGFGFKWVLTDVTQVQSDGGTPLLATNTLAAAQSVGLAGGLVNGNTALAIGPGAVATGDGAFAAGSGALAGVGSFAFGTIASADNDSLAVGNSASAVLGSICIGTSAFSTAPKAIVVGAITGAVNPSTITLRPNLFSVVEGALYRDTSSLAATELSLDGLAPTGTTDGGNRFRLSASDGSTAAIAQEVELIITGHESGTSTAKYYRANKRGLILLNASAQPVLVGGWVDVAAVLSAGWVAAPTVTITVDAATSTLRVSVQFSNAGDQAAKWTCFIRARSLN